MYTSAPWRAGLSLALGSLALVGSQALAQAPPEGDATPTVGPEESAALEALTPSQRARIDDTMLHEGIGWLGRVDAERSFFFKSFEIAVRPNWGAFLAGLSFSNGVNDGDDIFSLGFLLTLDIAQVCQSDPSREWQLATGARIGLAYAVAQYRLFDATAEAEAVEPFGLELFRPELMFMVEGGWRIPAARDAARLGLFVRVELHTSVEVDPSRVAVVAGLTQEITLGERSR